MPALPLKGVSLAGNQEDRHDAFLRLIKLPKCKKSFCLSLVFRSSGIIVKRNWRIESAWPRLQRQTRAGPLNPGLNVSRLF
jgi:hypothetical protein